MLGSWCDRGGVEGRAPAAEIFIAFTGCGMPWSMANNAYSATTEHPEPLTKPDTRPEIDDVIRWLVPSGSHSAIEALFDHRAPFSCIREWRRGRTGVPEWARDILAAKVLAQAEHYAHRAQRIAAIIPGPGRIAAAPNILAWNERRAKEKAGSKPASSE